jgi:hypothetical protein
MSASTWSNYNSDLEERVFLAETVACHNAQIEWKRLEFDARDCGLAARRAIDAENSNPKYRRKRCRRLSYRSSFPFVTGSI